MGGLSNIKKQTNTLKLLFVEDDLISREQVSNILKMFFKNLLIAKDGLEAWEIYKNNDFDLVITDIKMPNMDGIELTEKIKFVNPMQKVVIISAYNSSDHLLAAIRAGVDDFIIKPVEMDQFKLVIHKISIAIHNEKIKNYYQAELEREVASKTEELIKQSVTDKLTGLYNRNRLQTILAKNEKVVLMLLNIDNFDNINAAYGYTNGDLILRKIAHFLQNNLSENALLFRLGHDEFAILFKKTKLNQAVEYAKKLQHLILGKPINHDKTDVKFTATIVLAEGEKHLLKHVHLAFKETRAIGKNRIGIYHRKSGLEEHQKMLQKSMHMLSDVLSDAIEEAILLPYFQPIINNKTKQIEKYECLARIKYNGKILTPNKFIETAELTGRLPDITKLMIKKSFKYFKNRTEEFSINISEQDLNNDYLYKFMQKKIKKYLINPSRVVLEILEGISTNTAKKNIDQLIALKELGFQLAIDDFGAQNSNFERVHKLKVDYIKIDGSFIKNIDHDVMSYQVAKTITDFSKSIGAKVIAEYVHNEAVQKKILELGIDYSQGFYFSEPLIKV